jgi:hypothetical protein
MLAIDEHLKPVAFRKSYNQSLAMFKGAAGQIAGDAGIENAVAPIGHEIKPTVSPAMTA